MEPIVGVPALAGLDRLKAALRTLGGGLFCVVVGCVLHRGWRELAFRRRSPGDRCFFLREGVEESPDTIGQRAS